MGSISFVGGKLGRALLLITFALVKVSIAVTNTPRPIASRGEKGYVAYTFHIVVRY